MNIGHQIKVGEGKTIAFEAAAFNVLNQRAVTAYYGGMNSVNFATPLVPGNVGLYAGAATYQALESPYNVQQFINGDAGTGAPAVIKNSWYGKPFLFQNARSIRFTLKYTF